MQTKIPTLLELHHDAQEAFKNDQLNLLLNQPPHEKWVKKHPLAKVKDSQGNSVAASYLPIDKVEYLLTRIFQKWKVEVLREQVMFNSIAVAVRLHYLSPVDNQWYFHDGVGAKSVQVDAGQNAGNIGAIKDAAVMMALPSAKSYAIKDAAEHLGQLFGKDLNRAGSLMFTGSYSGSEVSAPEVKAGPERATQSQPITTQNKTEDFVL